MCVAPSLRLYRYPQGLVDDTQTGSGCWAPPYVAVSATALSCETGLQPIYIHIEKYIETADTEKNAGELP